MNCEIPNSFAGLVANFHFNQGLANGINTGLTSLTDASGLNNNGTLNNFALTGVKSNWIAPGAVTPGVACQSSLSTINIKLIPEGFYNAITEKLNMDDSVRTYLHSNVSPYGIVDSSIAVFDSATFSGALTFDVQSGTYYIVVKHRNTIETWSRPGGEAFTQGTTMNYDFTDLAAKAFGNNMKQVDTSPLRFGVYSGDINNDGAVDLTDIIGVFNDANNFVTGYVITDLTGDFFVDLTDLTLTYNNSITFVSVIRP
jgi:hypothetical protein